MCFSPSPSFSASLIPSANAAFEALILLEFSLALSVSSLEALYQLFYISTLPSWVSAFLHRIWFKSWIDGFKSRSTFLHNIKRDTHLSIGIPVVYRIHRHQPRLLRTPTHRSVACVRQHVFLIRRCMVATVLLPHLCCRWFAVARGFLCWREVFQRRRVVYTCWC